MHKANRPPYVQRAIPPLQQILAGLRGKYDRAEVLNAGVPRSGHGYQADDHFRSEPPTGILSSRGLVLRLNFCANGNENNHPR